MTGLYIHSFIVLLIIIIFYFINNLLKNNNKERFDSGTTIPKIIIQTWKDENIPTRYVSLIESVKRYNPTYEYMYFTDIDIENFLIKYYPNYYETFLKLPVTIQKIDFFRYIAVYHYGGFYFDLDMTGFLPLDDLLYYDIIFPLDIHLYDNCYDIRTLEFCNNNKLKIKYLLGQYAFAASKNNKFIKFIIDGIHNNINNYIYEDKKDQKFNREYYIYKTTGPDYVTRMYLNYDDKDSIYIIKNKNNYEQYFGDYAKHNFYGTWK